MDEQTDYRTKSSTSNGDPNKFIRKLLNKQPRINDPLFLVQGTVEDYPPEALIDTITPDFSLPDDITDITKDSDTVDETSSGTCSIVLLFIR